MTTPAPGQPIGLTDVLTELRITNPGRALPISLGDADVRALAGIPSGPISLGDCSGKTNAPGYTPMSGNFNSNTVDSNANPPANTTVHAPVSVTIAGDTAPISYTWTKDSGDGTLFPANSANVDVTFVNARFSAPGNDQQCNIRCVARDAANNTLTLTGFARMVIG